MNVDQAVLRKLLREDLTEVLIRFGLIAFLVILCARVFAPFAMLAILSMTLAVALDTALLRRRTLSPTPDPGEPR